MKTEPGVFSFQDLLRAPHKTTSWEGVRNYQARNFMRDQFKLGDRVLIYHSNTEEPAVVGVAEVVREAYADASAMDSKSRYFDPDAKKKGENPWRMVDVKAVHAFAEPVSRDRLRSTRSLEKMMVLQKGSRLSIQPVTQSEFDSVCQLGKATSV